MPENGRAMTEATKRRSTLMILGSLAVALALAIGWYADRSVLVRQIESERGDTRSARARAKQAAADLAKAKSELKLMSQALVDQDETRVLVGRQLQACEAREFEALAKLAKSAKR